MFYQSKDGPGLPYDPFKAIVAPRPIGWISTTDREGRPNVAPYSFFNAMASRPNMVGFTSEGLKHSMRNARDTREFVFNLVTLPLVDAMNKTSSEVPDGESEFEFAGLEMAPSTLVKPPRVAASPAALECRLVHFTEFHDIAGQPTDRYLAVGQVVGVHIDDHFIRDGRFDIVRAQTIARCGYRDYAVVSEVFELLRPTDPGRFVG
ncbi:flavin reductase family protein (plasmid) [Skermanella mucosa]|uniref:flavin reductase family protein n=1 Tax=Skermanella mucosa TaxID=1789672 RepID=UPI00192AA5FC|nr:flavin reductase family protein [Skermanella mucosa]UEM24488.1 flavin reductase family protein [Skermanella mucosa]